MNSLFRICTYRNVQMTINEGLRVNILCIINWLYDFCLTTSHTHLAVVKISFSFTHGWNGQLLNSGCPTRGGKNEFLEKSQKNYVDYSRYSSNENINLSFIG